MSAGDLMTDDVSLEDRLGCFGYYGFGSGYALAKWGTADDDQGALYCNRCRRNDRCWIRHRDRVRQLFPDLTALADAIAKIHRGPAYMTEWVKHTEQSRDSLVEPYTSVLMGNMEDGGAVALGSRPKDRGAGRSLAWPLVPLR